MFRHAAAVTALGTLCVVVETQRPLPVAGQEPASPRSSIYGLYGQASAGHDSIRVTKKSDGKIAVSIKLYYANGHTCRLSQDGEWHDDHVAILAEGLDEKRPCRLNAFFDKDHILLKDEGFQCAAVYCGTRGRFDGVSLSKFNPKPK